MYLAHAILRGWATWVVNTGPDRTREASQRCTSGRSDMRTASKKTRWTWGLAAGLILATAGDALALGHHKCRHEARVASCGGCGCGYAPAGLVRPRLGPACVPQDRDDLPDGHRDGQRAGPDHPDADPLPDRVRGPSKSRSCGPSPSRSRPPRLRPATGPSTGPSRSRSSGPSPSRSGHPDSDPVPDRVPDRAGPGHPDRRRAGPGHPDPDPVPDRVPDRESTRSNGRSPRRSRSPGP